MRYQILSAQSIRQLEVFVNNELKHGWRVTGGLAIYLDEEKEILRVQKPVFVQALIKEESP